MPPKLKRRAPGELPPAPEPVEPEEVETVSEPETIGKYDVVIIDDEEPAEEEPDLTIDLNAIVEEQQAKKPVPAPAPAPKSATKNPFLPTITILDRITP